jgi:Fe2+ or Zn2+ uptake regulation protein
MTEDVASFLRKHGVHVTAQRLAVLRAVSNHPHCTAEEIAAHVRGEIGTISRQAVYDALGILTDNGLLRRIEPAGSPALYECRVGDNHHHLICRICGKTADVDCTVGKAPCLIPSDAGGYQVDEAEVIFWGKCPDCLKASQRAASDRARKPRSAKSNRQTR